jgi:hypothetical protein
MGVDQARRLKELEAENARLKKAVADLTLDKIILTEAASRVIHRRDKFNYRKFNAENCAALNSRCGDGFVPCLHRRGPESSFRSC